MLVAVVLGVALSRNVGLFLHVTDTHTDMRYTPGAPTHCIEDDAIPGVGCCHASNTASTIKPNAPCSEWGAYNCDAPPKWTNESMHWIARNFDIDFVINTGDFASHHDVTQTPWENDEAVETVTKFMAEAFPNKPLLNTVGNHDGWPVDNTVPLVYEIMLENIARYWGPHLDSGAEETIRQGGYYSYVVYPGLRFVAINMLFFDGNNFIFKKEQKDPAWDPKGMWTWLNNTLAAARTNKEKVWMGFHFGPEAGEATYGYNVRLTQFFDDYQDVIQQAFCGHTHDDVFMIYSTHDNRPVMSAWAPGSLYASGHNPQFNIYKYDRDTFEIIDFDHYQCDLNTTISNNSPNCTLAYSFTSAYGQANFSTKSLVALYEELKTNQELMQVYHKNCGPGDNFDNTDNPDGFCDAQCAEAHLNEMIQNVAPAPWSGAVDSAGDVSEETTSRNQPESSTQAALQPRFSHP